MPTDLTIIAGCNGAGKSTFASTFLPEGHTSFDYDRIFLEYYNQLPDSELREKIARNQTTELFENLINNALETKTTFCYETNFDTNPVYWAQKFKEKGFRLNLVFFCIETQEIAQHRIQVRTEFNGHFINNETINYKWIMGYKNVNQYFDFFDNILFVDNSVQNKVYTNILQIKNKKIILITENIPNYFTHHLPQIYNLL